MSLPGELPLNVRAVHVPVICVYVNHCRICHTKSWVCGKPAKEYAQRNHEAYNL